jgi:hypothetical protein
MTTNMSMSGGGNIKSGPILPTHFKIWKHTPQRRKQVRRGKEQFAPFSFVSEVAQSPDSLGLWTEWLPTPYYPDPNTGAKKKGAYPDDIKSWLNQLNQFMKTYKSKTLVFRIQAPETGNWTDNVHYTDWLSYWALDNDGLKTLFSGVTTLKEIHFLPYINITHTTTKEEASTQASYAYDFIHDNLGSLTQSIVNASNVKTYMCIEPENINIAKSPPPASDYLNLIGTDANNAAQLTAMVVSKITKKSALLLSCVSAPTVGKSINLISGVDKYIGEWYSDNSSDALSPDFYNNSVSQITQKWLDLIKLGDTNMENYYAILSIETNYQRRPNNDSGNGDYKSPKTNSGAARLGPQPQSKTIQLAQSITTAYHLKNEVLVYSGEYLEQWGKSDPISIIANKPTDTLILQSL